MNNNELLYSNGLKYFKKKRKRKGNLELNMYIRVLCDRVRKSLQRNKIEY